MNVQEIADRLNRARACLRGAADEEAIVATRRDGASPFAFLVSLRPAAHRIACRLTEAEFAVFPLRRGKNIVDSSSSHSDYDTPRSLFAGILEGGQWIVDVDAGSARLTYETSTNGTVRLSENERQFIGALWELQAQGIGQAIPNAAVVRNKPLDVHLREGDVLVNVYAAFAFGWLGRPTPP